MDNSKINTDQVKLTEHLSALLDDEAGSFEQRRVLDELKTDQDLSSKLSSFALIGESMRAETSQVTVPTNFLSSIHEKIDAEPEFHQVHLENTQSEKSNNSWLRPIGGFAMAASVAAIAVLGIQNYQKTSDPLISQGSIISQKQSSPSSPMKKQLSKMEMASATIVSATDMVAVNDVTKSSNDYVEADAKTRSFLKRYVDSHMQHASTSSFVPSVRVIAYAE